MNKKGISPLIGTVLLVAIVIAMVLLIMPWITKTIKTQQEKSTEALTAMDCIDKLGFELLIGAGNAIIVDNTGEADIYALSFRRYGIDGKIIDTPKLENQDSSVYFESFTTSSPTTIVCDPATVSKVEAIATISAVGGKKIVCADNSRDIYC